MTHLLQSHMFIEAGQSASKWNLGRNIDGLNPFHRLGEGVSPRLYQAVEKMKLSSNNLIPPIATRKNSPTRKCLILVQCMPQSLILNLRLNQVIYHFITVTLLLLETGSNFTNYRQPLPMLYRIMLCYQRPNERLIIQMVRCLRLYFPMVHNLCFCY